MSDIKARSPLPHGSGLIIAGLFGFIGLATAIVLWCAGAGILISLLAYLTVSPVLLAILCVLTGPARPAEDLVSRTFCHV
ncbi:MAG: hypothetical protein CML66_18230 [Rhodobacteraceae bacterium]|nr:hypothetical protein [Paracoccaceae bacterium]MAY44925.1 hypothetical protein [Paracoccaceae bacterium]QEW20804.1 hypothetical protein LA6_003004 [Marinibacterium anthonyi]